MAIDYSEMAFPKSRPRALVKEEKRHVLALTDAKESAKARKRAKGQCEVQVLLVNVVGRKQMAIRCTRKDVETHHLLGGIGRRNRSAKSLSSDHKLRVCQKCHAEITAHILKPTTAEADAHTIRFWRSR